MSDDDIKLPEPALYVGTRLFPYEQHMFSTPGLRERLGYDSATADYYTAEQLRAAVLADRASRADHFRDATNLVNESAAVLDVLTSVLPPGHRLRQDAERGAKRLVAGLYELAASFSTDAAPSPQGDAEDAARYRWLRERWGRLAESYVGPVVQAIQVLDDRDIQDGIAWDVDPESLDRAIDAARSTPATEKGAERG